MHLYKSQMPNYEFLLIYSSSFISSFCLEPGCVPVLVNSSLGKREDGVKREAQSPVFPVALLITGSVWIVR